MTIRSVEPEAESIISDLHRIREDLLAEHGQDLLAYAKAAQKRLKESGKPVVTRPRLSNMPRRKSGH